jgi:hypothetical protein
VTFVALRDNIERIVAPLLVERTWTTLSIIEPPDLHETGRSSRAAG